MEDILHHQSSRFDAELGKLRSDVLKMGGLVENQVLRAIEVYGSCDLSLAQKIRADDKEINALEKTIDEASKQVIARRQPAAVDLRLVFGILKIVTDLERVGDESKKIAKGVRRIAEVGQSPLSFSSDVRPIAEKVLVMVRESLDAFARLDPKLAVKVIEDDLLVDAEFKVTVQTLVTDMQHDTNLISSAIDLLWIARAIERIGDHAKNIAEHVVFIVEGRDIRHSKEKKDEIENKS